MGVQAIELARGDLAAHGIGDAKPLDERESSVKTGLEAFRAAFAGTFLAEAADEALVEN